MFQYEFAVFQILVFKLVFSFKGQKEMIGKLNSPGSSGQCSVMTQMGGMGVGEREVQKGGNICIHTADSVVQQRLAQHCKANILL